MKLYKGRGVILFLSGLLVVLSVLNAARTPTAEDMMTVGADRQGYIKWVDFNPTSQAMSDALTYDVKTYGTDRHISWVTLLALLAARSGGEFSGYKSATLKELTDKLEQGVREIFTSGRYTENLAAMSKFHTYIFGNVMLILMQNPAASCVAGFHTWKKEFGRNVKAHESGLKILAPCPYRRFIEQDKLDKDGTPVLDAAGEPLRERTLVQYMRFRIVTVFDISQTEGKELPSIGVSELSGNIDRFEELANAITSVSPVPILYKAPHGAAKGCFNHVTEEILIRPGMSQKQTVKTMLHEISHATLHRRKKNEPPYKDQHTREVEAESVAYVVCQHFGIDTSDYSFGYVAGWSKGKELNELKASLDTIRSCAADLIDAIAEKCPSLQPKKESMQSFPER